MLIYTQVDSLIHSIYYYVKMENIMFYRMYEYNGLTLAALIFFFLALACALPTGYFLFNVHKQKKQLKDWLYLYILLILTFLGYLIYYVSPLDSTCMLIIMSIFKMLISGSFIMFFGNFIQSLNWSGFPLLRISLSLCIIYCIGKSYSIINHVSNGYSTLYYTGDFIFILIIIFQFIFFIKIEKKQLKVDYKYRRFVRYAPLLLIVSICAECFILHQSFRCPGFITSVAWLIMSFYLIRTTTMKFEERRVQTHQSFVNVMNSYGLTKREQTIASMLIKDLTYKEISTDLYISIETVKTHAYNIYQKTNIHHRRELKTKLYTS